MNGTLEIALPCGKICIIDTKNAWIRSVFPSWRACRGYVKVCRYIKTEYGTAKEDHLLHRLLAKAKNGIEVDHINRNPLDNREDNLRWVTHKQNSYNKGKISRKCSSKYRGVNFFPRANLARPWRAYMCQTLNGTKKWLSLGYFATEDEAAAAYDREARARWGIFAFQNISNNNPQLEAYNV